MIVETKKGKLPVRFSMNAFAHFGDMTGKTMNQVLGELNSFGEMLPSEILKFIYAGFVDGAKFAGEECQVQDVYEVGNMITDDADLINKVTKVYIGGMEAAEGDSKKK